MERRKPAVTPENYIRAIISFSKRYSSTSTFPGNNFIDIGQWLLQDRGLFNPVYPDEGAILFASKSQQPHDLVVVYNYVEKGWDVQHYRQEERDVFYAAPFISAHGAGQIVFIRGFISPSWMSVIGSKYNIDPEFFRRHMDFLSASIDRHAYSYPSLSSSSNNIFRLCVSTLLHRDNFGKQDLKLQRSDQSSELHTYRLRQLGSNKVCCGDSLVREYSTVCSRFSVIEQWISLCVTKTDKGWAVIAWMDQGRPLEESPPGPWSDHVQSKATPLPVLQYHDKMAFRTTTNRLDPGANASAEIPQSATVLPLQYDQLIALVDLSRRASHDPLSMCIPLFAHAAFSEVQFLNLMASSIQVQIKSIAEGVLPDALETFQYFSDILDRHAQQLKDSSRALSKLAEHSSRGLNEAKAESTPSKSNVTPSLSMGLGRHASKTETAGNYRSSSSESAFTVKGLLEDYEELHIRCMDLSAKCSRGITLAMNKATIDESRKAIEQSGRLKNLTLLATLFIPLSFTSSLFGMNIDIFDQSGVSIWWFLVLCVPITLSAYIFYLWDFLLLKRWVVRLGKSCCDFKEIMRDERRFKNQHNIA